MNLLLVRLCGLAAYLAAFARKTIIGLIGFILIGFVYSFNHGPTLFKVLWAPLLLYLAIIVIIGPILFAIIVNRKPEYKQRYKDARTLRDMIDLNRDIIAETPR